MNENKFEMVAKTFQGLEDVLRDELISLGAENVEMGRRMVSFEGDLAMMYKANLCCRTALRILKPIEKFTAHDPEELYDVVREIEWDKYMGLKTTFSIDSTVNSDEFSHSKFVTYRVKDGIVDYFREKYGERPSVRVSGADMVLNVHIFENRVTISLDSSGEPLSKRGYRVEQTAAPINEVLAAGIIMKTGWRGDCNFADPMCGSGTFLIEAALIAANINPGIFRQQFAFEKWPDFDKELFEDIYNDDSQEREFAYKIYGGDIDAEAIAIARKNIKEAKVEDMIELEWKPLAEWTENAEPGVLVTNPPYGERLKPEDMAALYKNIGFTLKNYFQGWHAWIIGLNDEDFRNIGLKPTVKIPLLNGSLECSLREYVMFDGKYDEFRAGGNSLGKHLADEDESSHPKKMKHLSDDEWRNETRKFGHNDRKKERRAEGGERREYKSDRKKERRAEGGERREYKSDRKEFKKEFKGGDRREFKKEFKGGDRRDFKGDFKGGDRREFKGERREFKGRDKGGYNDKYSKSGIRKIHDKGPSLSMDDAMVFSKVPMRSRRKKGFDED